MFLPSWLWHYIYSQNESSRKGRLLHNRMACIYLLKKIGQYSTFRNCVLDARGTLSLRLACFQLLRSPLVIQILVDSFKLNCWINFWHRRVTVIGNMRGKKLLLTLSPMNLGLWDVRKGGGNPWRTSLEECLATGYFCGFDIQSDGFGVAWILAS